MASKLSIALVLLLASTSFATEEKIVANHVSIAWEALPGAIEYEMEISSSSNMVPALIAKKLKTNQIDLRAKRGAYFFRVRGISKDGSPGLWSDIKPFLVNQFPPRLEEPRLSEREVAFRWKPGFSGTVYGIEVREAGKPLLLEMRSTADFLWRPTKAGLYQWRVGYETLGTIHWGPFREVKVDQNMILDPNLALNEVQILSHVVSIAVPGLRWSSLRANVRPTAVGEEVKLMAMLEGEWMGKGSVLEINQRKIQRGPFKFTLPIRNETQVIRVTARGEDGKVYSEEIQLFYPRLEEYVSLVKYDRARKHYFSIGLGITSVNYTQTGQENFSQVSTSGKVGYRALLGRYFDFGASGYLTLFPLTKSLPSVSAQFYGLNLRLGWVVPSIRRPWNLSLMLGGYYSAMIVTDEIFGYKNVYGPQFYPVLSWTLDGGSVISGYLKYSPISNGAALLAFGNRELATGLSWGFPLNRKHRLGATFDVADLTLTTGALRLHSRSYTLGVVFQW